MEDCPRIRPKLSAGVPSSGWQKGPPALPAMVSSSSPAPGGASTGRLARSVVESAPSSVTRLVTLTICCRRTASTEPKCPAIHGSIASGGTNLPLSDAEQKDAGQSAPGSRSLRAATRAGETTNASLWCR